MDVWFSIEEEPPPRGAKASWRDLKTFVSPPPERVRKAFALLTQTYHGCRQPLPNLVTSELPVTQHLTASGWRLDSLPRDTGSRARSQSAIALVASSQPSV